jgi:hypothetical protein
MTRKGHLFGALVLAFVTTLLLATPASADLICRGGANDGDPCTTDADCPGACQQNVAHPVCAVYTDCPNVCKGGTAPGTECPDGDCPGVCVSGPNAGNACMNGGDCPNSRCNAACKRDKCRLGRCKNDGPHSLSAPISELEEEEDIESGEEAVACTVN